jgi:hypothetical protein
MKAIEKKLGKDDATDFLTVSFLLIMLVTLLDLVL